MQYSLKSIECFVAVYEQGSVTAAAERLSIGQPAVSMQLRRLEEAWGATLFDREGRAFVATAVAERAYPECRQLLLQARRVDSALADAVARVDDGVSIGVPPMLARTIVPAQLLPLRESHPALRITLREGVGDDLQQWVASDKVDFAYVDTEIATDAATTESRTLVSENLYLLTAIDAAVDTVTPVRLLPRFRLALPPSTDGVHRTLKSLAMQSGTTLDCAIEVDSITTLVDLARHPGWATVLPGSAALPHVRSGGWRASRLVEPRAARNISVLRRKGQVPSSAEQWMTRRLQEALVAPLQEDGYPAG